MSVHARNFVVCSKEDEQFGADDRNNNLRNDQGTEKSIEKQRTMIDENNSGFDVQQWNRTDDSHRKYQSGQHKTDRHSNEIQSRDSHSSELVATTKSNTSINFSVDSILSSTNVTRKCGTDKLSDAVNNSPIGRCNSPKSTSIDDFNRIHRPMPMRYLPNPSLFQGKKTLFSMTNSYIFSFVVE